MIKFKFIRQWLLFCVVLAPSVASSSQDMLAVVYGEKIDRARIVPSMDFFKGAENPDEAFQDIYRNRLEDAVVMPALIHFGRDVGVTEASITEPEMQSFYKYLHERRGQKEINESIYRQAIFRWKLKMALYKKYGGKCIYRYDGVFPGEAVARLLTDEARRGNIKVFSPNDRKMLGSLNTVSKPISVRAANYFLESPWWERKPKDLTDKGFLLQDKLTFVCLNKMTAAQADKLLKP